MKIKYTKEEEEILVKNYKKFGPEHCSKLMPHPRTSIISKANKLGLFLTKNKKYELACKAKEKIIHKVKVEQFLNIIDPNVAYFLGFLWADGCLPKTKGCYAIVLEISTKDEKDIEKNLMKLGNWNKYYKTRNTSNVVKFVTNNKLLYNFLKENDYLIKSGASPDKILSEIPEHLQHYWWRGYFDGDGCISLNADDIRICSVYNQNWNFLKSKFNQLNIPINLKNVKVKNALFLIVRFAVAII